ncbi:MAG: 4Fe-4S binding protein [Synergistaceae bacterium]|nr:4Fe-4S binding protein [Synergistota bacterium]NLM70681.1 4Fe-4S binding protein [Synergistaceae bacterium]
MKFLRYSLDKCVMCGACMSACSKLWAKQDNPEMSRISVKNVTGLPDIRVCDQCGGCIAVCPTMALYRDKNGVVQIDREKCTSCLMCVEFCPYASMFFHAEIPSPFKCVACGVCVKACPEGVLSICELED